MLENKVYENWNTEYCLNNSDPTNNFGKMYVSVFIKVQWVS